MNDLRAALAAVPSSERDAWIDRFFGIDSIPEDEPDLPRGCVPYLPCPVDTIVRMVELARVQADDVVVDVGSGMGRAAALIHLLTGASVIGVEVQAALVRAARALAARLNAPRVTFVHGDAARSTAAMASGSVFFLYCPFSGARLEVFLDELEQLARARPLRVCCVDLPLPPRPWLSPLASSAGGLSIYRT